MIESLACVLFRVDGYPDPAPVPGEYYLSLEPDALVLARLDGPPTLRLANMALCSARAGRLLTHPVLTIACQPHERASSQAVFRFRVERSRRRQLAEYVQEINDRVTGARGFRLRARVPGPRANPTASR